MAEDQEFVLPPLDERPLVTFALFAYNQEKYIREAVEGAFAQTYEPLEIILSDDCSTDRTFEIMEDAAKKYTGSQKVILNKNQVNYGLIQHINKVSELASGKIIIMAAGDDISRPERAALSVGAFSTKPRSFAVFFDVEPINDFSQSINKKSNSWVQEKALDVVEITRNGGGVGPGASYAYRKECFDWPWAVPPYIRSEDRLLPLRAACLGEVNYFPTPVIKYRIIESSLTAVLERTGNMAIQSDRHIEELFRTIEIAFSERRITKDQKKICARLIRNMPLYAKIVEKAKGGAELNLLDNITLNWIHRDSLFVRVKRYLAST